MNTGLINWLCFLNPGERLINKNDLHFNIGRLSHITTIKIQQPLFKIFSGLLKAPKL